MFKLPIGAEDRPNFAPFNSCHARHFHSCNHRCIYPPVKADSNPHFQRHEHQQRIRPKTPPRQDSSYFSETGEGDISAHLKATLDQGKNPTRLVHSQAGRHEQASTEDSLAVSELDENIQVTQIRARERVVIFRGRVRRTRDMIKNHRIELRQQQEHVRDIVEKLARKITELVTLGRLEDISFQHGTLKTAQDRLGPLEEEYEKLEIRLEAEECELETEEEIFYRHYDAAIDVPESRLDEVISPRTRGPEISELDVQPLDLNEPLQDYLNKIEDANRTKDELDDLESDFLRHSEDADILRRHSYHLSPEVASFLQGYDDLHARLLSRIYNIEDEIFDLRDKCLQDEMFGSEDFKYEAYSALYDEWMEPVYYTQDRSPLRVAARQGLSREVSSPYGDVQDSVNRWILEWSQDSTIHVLLLKEEILFQFTAYAGLQSESSDDNNWADMAVQHWNQDGAGKFANVNFEASRFDRILGSERLYHGTSTACSRSFQDNLADFGSDDEPSPEIEPSPCLSSPVLPELMSMQRRASV